MTSRTASLTTALLAAAVLACSAAPLSTPPAAAPETATLFQYHRDDATPDHVTRIRINAARGAATAVNQDVFGNFVEHLGGSIYEGLWAQALLNPSLERIEAQDTEPLAWDMTGAAAWREDGGYQSPAEVRLSGPDGVLSQRVFLPAYRTRRYTVTLYARAPQGPGQVSVALTAGAGMRGPVILQTPLPLTGSDWQKTTLHWDLPAGPPAKGQPARVVLTHTGGGPVDVDQITVFPDDAVDGIDPDVLAKARAWHIPILRLAGNFSSGYHWRDGVGPQTQRPTQRNPAWGGIEPNSFGTDEYLDFARRIGATPQIGVNAGDGTPEEAAAWVRYCNAKTERVPVWEIGNELYGGWQIGHTDAAGNADRFVRFRAAMQQADPKIKIIATGKGEEFGPSGLTRDQAWNEAVLRAAVAGGGPPPDFLSIHPLVPLPGGLDNFPYAEQWQSAMAHPEYLDRTLIPALARLITGVEGPHPRTRIAPTEWGIILGGDRWQESPNHNAVGGAIFNALTLNAMLRHSDWVTLANMTALMHGGGIKKPNGVVIVDPQYYTQQLYAAARPHTPVATDWTGPGTDVPQRGFLPAVPDVPDVDVFSALSDDRRRLTAFVVNRDLNEARPVSLEIAGFTASAADATILTAPDPQAHNTWEAPDTVAPHPFPVPAPKLGAAGTYQVSLPPHSLVVFSFRRLP